GYAFWAPADLTASNTTSFRLYETADVTSGHLSGLVLGPVSSVLSVNDASAASKIDLVLATDPSINLPQISVQSAHLVITGGRATDIDDTIRAVVGGLAMENMPIGV